MNKTDNQEICLLNDSFPPEVDGVANAVVNYARVISAAGKNVSVVTPQCPGADDSSWNYPVIRYPSIDLRDTIGYTAGNPFSIPTLVELTQRNICLLHSHCPVMSNTIARALRESMDIPFILTYHTKFDIDISNAIKLKGLQAGAIRALVHSVGACDELWVVSEGAGKNIRQLGYKGDYIVMPNGVDMPKQRVSDSEILSATGAFDLPENVPVFLFVGRLMWYKGLRIIFDALAALKSRKLDFRMVLIGGGGDEVEVKQYAEKLGLGDKVIFTGKIFSRTTLAAWYCRADLLLFPSTFDTNGLVVREAAACSLGTVLVSGSCAAEGVVDGTDGLLIDENAASLAVCLAQVMNNRDMMKQIGTNAANNLYFSWDDSVKNAMERYEIVLDGYKRGRYSKRRDLSDEMFALSGDIIDFLVLAEEHKALLEEKLERYM